MAKEVEKYYNEKGELGVLICCDHGAGWSSVNDKELAYDKRIIEKWLERVDSDEMEEYIKSLGYNEPCMFSYLDLKLKFVPRGTMFCICEYDGYERIETPETLCMMIA